MKVDVKHIIDSKNPALARCIPPPLIRRLRRFIHEDEINFYLENFSHLPPVEFVRAVLCNMQITCDMNGIEKLDPHGRYIFASNHPFGGLDGLVLADKVSGYFGDARLIVNDLLMNLEPLKPIFVPVNKHGRQNPHYFQLHDEIFSSDIPIITFPAGLCSRRKNGSVEDLEWKPNFIKRAVSFQRDIVPVFFDGRLSDFFYRLSNLRVRLGIKPNIEMVCLPDEMFKQHGSHFNITAGDPVGWESLRVKNARDAAAEIRKKVYALKKTI